MQNQLSKTDRLSNQDIRKRLNVKKTIIGVLILLIGLSHLPEAVLLNIDEISSGNILYLITCILICAIGIYQLKFRSKEMKYLPTKSVVKEKNYSFNLKYMESLKEMIESGNFSNSFNIKKEKGETSVWMSSCRLIRNLQPYDCYSLFHIVTFRS